MAGDRDLSSLLPDAPPPRPAQRAAAIEAALRRFDGVPDPPAAVAASMPPAQPGWWQRLAGPQLGAVVAILLVALVALPVWMSERDRIAPPAAVAPHVEPSSIASARAPDTRARSAAPSVPNAVAVTSAPVSTNTTPASARPAAPSVAAEPAPMPPPPAAPAPAPEREMVVTAQRRQEFHQDTSVAITAVTPDSVQALPSAKAAGRVATAEDSAEVVVTGSRINPEDARAAAAARRRGDWNACTIDDPGQSVEACRKRVDPATPLGEGIVKAWAGDIGGAIAAFDRAIAAQPRKAAAWLNRGLAHAQEGDYDKALADLDRAVRIEPGAARNFYHRSVIYRRLGDARRADRDATRVLEMDSRYRDLVP